MVILWSLQDLPELDDFSFSSHKDFYTTSNFSKRSVIQIQIMNSNLRSAALPIDEHILYNMIFHVQLLLFLLLFLSEVRINLPLVVAKRLTSTLAVLSKKKRKHNNKQTHIKKKKIPNKKTNSQKQNKKCWYFSLILRSF